MMEEPDETLILLGAYQDGELSPREVLDMEQRLAAEPELRALFERLGGLSGRVQAVLAEPPVPADLRARVIRQVAGAAPARMPRSVQRAGWQALAASLLVGVLIGGLAGGSVMQMVGRGAPTPVGAAVLAGHLRALAAPQPFDIASSDRHVVKPWFNGRTTLAPSAPDLADKGFPLVGGRVDVIDGKAVPTLVYNHDRHIISVTIVPKGAGMPPPEEHRDGSTILAWTAGDLAYYAVSDLNRRDLSTFAELFRQQM